MVDKIWYNMEELIGGSEERGINRNILECKEKRRGVCVTHTGGINRNILECKDNRTRNLQYLGYSINRNILECKVIRSTRPSRRSVY